MKKIYPAKAFVFASLLLLSSVLVKAQVPSQVTQGACPGVVANFNTNDNGFNSPSVYGSIFDSSFYYHGGRGYWTDYSPPYRTTAPGFPRVLNIISPPYVNPNPNGTFNVGFYYIVPNAFVDRFQVRIISVTQTSNGTVTNIEATSGVQFFADWSTPTPYVDGVTPVANPVPDPTPFLIGQQGNVCIRLIDSDIQNGPATTFRVEVTYLVNSAFFAVFDNLSIGAENIPLPVNFIGLVADRNAGHGVDLKWDVSEEVDVREYQVERSENGYSFEKVGAVAAKGKSIYSFVNYNVPASTVYYRVKSVDIDGKFKYSGILKLSGSNSFSSDIQLYPVPARDEVTIQHKRLAANAKVIITSVEGRIYKVMNPREGASHTMISISDLAPGVYVIRLDNGKGDIQSAKLIKN
ncbi:MAG: T9SS type A sorting domain-containing protein [Chitinophagaceae bacterium]|nr:T9SS type A sorting domain-containing protein [Chitinophagaceae bacterium]